MQKAKSQKAVVQIADSLSKIIEHYSPMLNMSNVGLWLNDSIRRLTLAIVFYLEGQTVGGLSSV